MDPSPATGRLSELLRAIPETQLEEIRRRHPGRPLLEALRAERALPDETLRQLEEALRLEDATALLPDLATSTPATGLAGLLDSVGRILEARAPGSAMARRVPGDPLRDAREFGRYEIRERLGVGGMGAVYRVYDPALDREVALKVMTSTPVALGDRAASLASRFTVEARAAAGLSHPNLVAVHEVGEADGIPYYTQELVAARSLADLLSRRHLSPEESLRLIAQAAHGLHHAHSRGVVHRDVKPANLLVSDDLRIVKVADFGIALREGAEGGTIEGDLLGTPHYMSPEQARGAGHVADARTDIYGLGATLYECLTGRRPFEGCPAPHLLWRIAQGDVPRPRGVNRRVPEEVEWICLRSMERDPTLRYPTALALAEDIDRYLTGRPLEARGPSLGYRVKKVIARNRRACLVGAFALAAGGVGFLYHVSESRRLESEAHAAVHAHRAGVAFAAGNLDEAGELVSKALETSPRQPDALYWQARLLLQRYLAARGMPCARVVLGRVQLLPSPPETERSRTARAELERALQRIPSRTLFSGYLALVDGKFEEALEELHRVPDGEPGSWGARLGEARALYMLGRLSEAEERIQERLGLDATIVGPVWWRLALARGLAAGSAGEEPAGWFAQVEAMGQRMEHAGLREEGRLARAMAQVEWGRADAGVGRDPEERYGRSLAALEGLDGPEVLATVAITLLARAEFLVERGRVDPESPAEYKEAIDAWSRAIEADPSTAQGWCGRAEAYLARWALLDGMGRGDTADLERARDDFAGALERVSTYEAAEIGLARAIGALARAERGAVDVAAAFLVEVDALSEVTRRHPGSPIPFLARSAAYRRLAEARVSAGTDPGDDHRAAMADAETATRLAPDLAEAYRERALARQGITLSLFRAGHDPEEGMRLAIGDFSKSIALRPRHAAALVDRGSARILLGDLRYRKGLDPVPSLLDGIEDLAEALRVNPSLAPAYVRRAEARLALGVYRAEQAQDSSADHHAAIEDLVQAIRTDPSLSEAYVVRGNALLDHGSYLEQMGGDPADSYEKAIVDQAKAIQLRPTDIRAHIGRGAAKGALASYLGRKGEDARARHQEALSDLTQALALAPCSVEAWSERGRLLQNFGLHRKQRGDDPTEEYASAIDHFTRALAIDPTCVDVLRQRGLVRQNLGTYLEEQGRDSSETDRAAIEDFHAALAVHPKDARCWVFLGMTLRRVARLKGGDVMVVREALDAFDHAIEANPDHANAYRHRGQIHLELGEPAKALQDFHRAERLNPELGEGLAPWIDQAREQLR